ncbi:unnamed protein product [Rangifer tarandus platyrhynchus]|uniref:Uncharacterized protein n=2 Tax=Rangifer tarandus platyrhynchus TaxID=3082113 RepID=A0ABN8Y4F6_RANTA|nr:unnamed protein product [Rangifer tarandus platyrhynchus]
MFSGTKRTTRKMVGRNGLMMYKSTTTSHVYKKLQSPFYSIFLNKCLKENQLEAQNFYCYLLLGPSCSCHPMTSLDNGRTSYRLWTLIYSSNEPKQTLLCV